MPHKTKKQKLVAGERKQQRLLKYYQSSQMNPLSPVLNIKPNTTKIEVAKKTRFSEDDRSLVRYFSQDFKKSLLLITTIVMLEILIYFATIKQYLRLNL